MADAIPMCAHCHEPLELSETHCNARGCDLHAQCWVARYRTKVGK